MSTDVYLTEKQRIEEQISQLQQKAKELQQRHREPAINTIILSMAEYDITPEEITAAFTKQYKRRSGRSGSGAPRKPVAIKYRHPDTGETWTGRGKAPRWVTAAEAEGKSRDLFLVA